MPMWEIAVKQTLGFLMLASGFIGGIAFLISHTDWGAVLTALSIAAGIMLWVGVAVWLLVD